MTFVGKRHLTQTSLALDSIETVDVAATFPINQRRSNATRGDDVLNEGSGPDSLQGGACPDTSRGAAGGRIDLGVRRAVVPSSTALAAFDKNRPNLRGFCVFDELADALAARVDLRGSAVITGGAAQTIARMTATKVQNFAGLCIFFNV